MCAQLIENRDFKHRVTTVKSGIIQADEVFAVTTENIIRVK